MVQGKAREQVREKAVLAPRFAGAFAKKWGRNAKARVAQRHQEEVTAQKRRVAAARSAKAQEAVSKVGDKGRAVPAVHTGQVPDEPGSNKSGFGGILSGMNTPATSTSRTSGAGGGASGSSGTATTPTGSRPDVFTGRPSSQGNPTSPKGKLAKMMNPPTPKVDSTPPELNNKPFGQVRPPIAA